VDYGEIFQETQTGLFTLVGLLDKNSDSNGLAESIWNTGRRFFGESGFIVVMKTIKKGSIDLWMIFR
jgi:hypothetical protein